MDKPNQDFWQGAIKQSRYMPIAILFSVLMLLWKPAFPYLYLGAVAAVLHVIVEIAFYRKAQTYFFGVYMFFLLFLKGRAEELYPIKDEPFSTDILLLFMFLGVYLGVRGLLHLIFRRVIVNRVGLDTVKSTS